MTKRYVEIKARPTNCIEFTKDGGIAYKKAGTYAITTFEDNKILKTERFRIHEKDEYFEITKMKKQYPKKKKV